MPIPRQYRQPPPIQTGYALPPFFSVVVPIARTNEITNPSAETGTTGYTAGAGSLARSTTYQYHGAYSLAYTPSAATTDGFYYTISTSVAVRAISCKFLGVAGIKYTLAVATTGAVDLVTYTFTASGRWQWVYLYFNETSISTRRIYFRKANSTSVAPFYVDGVQSEIINAGELVSTYIDGDQVGLVPNQSPAAYVWNGTPHASSSTRSGQTRAGGMVMRLDLYGFLLLSMIGLNLPTANNVSVPYVQLDGAQYERTQKPPRQFTLAGQWSAPTFSQLQRQVSALSEVLDRDRVGQQQPLTLLYQGLDSCNRPTSDVARIACSYAGGLEGQTDNLHAEQASMVFQQWLPTILSDAETGASLNPIANVTNANYIVQRTAAGVWSAMGSGLTGGLARCVLPMPDGTIVVGGDFTGASGVANTAGIARYTPATNTWSALGTGAAGGVVYNLASSPSGDIYAVGTFTSMGGVANTKFVARYTGGAWTSMGGGYAAGSGIFAVAYASATLVILGGDAVTNNGVSQYNPVTNALAGALTAAGGGSPAVRTVAITSDLSTLYVGGTFTTLGGTSAVDIAKYTFATATVSALGTGMNNTVDSIVIAPDNSIYVGGLFTTAGGVTVNRIAQYVGGGWQPLGTGMDAEVSRVAIAPDGRLWATGLFTTAGGVSLFGGVAIWSGAAWTYPDFQIPGSADARAIGFTADGAIYLGFNSTGTGVGGQATSVTNGGTARAYPTIVLTGPTSGASRIYSISNRTTGRSLFFSTTISAGETITVTLDPSNLSVVSNSRGNIISTVLPGSNEADWFLQPGANSISYYVADSSATAIMRWRSPYNGVADLTL